MNLLLPLPHQNVRHTFYRDFPNQIYSDLTRVLYAAISAIVIKQCLGGNDWEVAIIHSCMMSGLLLSLLYSQMGRDKNPVRMVFFPQLIGRAVLIGVAFIHDSFMFTILLGIVCFLHTLSAPYLSVVYQRQYPAQTRGKIISICKQWGFLFSVVLSWILGSVFQKDNEAFRYVYPVAGLIGVSAIIWFSTIQCKETKKQNTRSFRELPKILFQDKNFARFMTLQFLLGISFQAANTVFYIYVNKKQFLACTPYQASLITAFFPPLAMLLTMRIWGGIFDKLNITWYRAIASSLIAIGFLLYTLQANLIFIYIGVLLLSAGRAGGQVAWSLGVLDFASSDQISSYLGIHTFLTGVRGIFAPFIGVAMLKMGYSPLAIFILASTLIAISAIFTPILVKVPNRH